MSEAIVLIPGFSGYISIQDQNEVELFHREINSSQEGQEFLREYGQSVPGWSACAFSLIPVRTDAWGDFAKDLFLPAFINGALRVDCLFCQVIVSILAIAVDIVTFPVRLITAPLRAVYNCMNRSEHPIASLIAHQDAAQEALENGQLEVVITGKQVTIHPDEGELSRAIQVSKKVHVLVVTKELPAIQQNAGIETKITTYIGYEGDWAIESHISSSDSGSTFAF